MIKVQVDPGICGLKTEIRAGSEDMQTVHLEIVSDCPDIQKAAAELTEVDGMAEAFGKTGDTPAYQILRKYCRHAACPVPSAVIKAAEAACGFALPKNVSFTIEKTE